MSIELPRIVRRLLALGLLLALAAAFIEVAVRPVAAHLHDLRDQIAQQRFMLGKLMQPRPDAQQIEATTRAARSARDARLYLEGETDALRHANLQSQLATIAEHAGVKPRSQRNVPARERNEVRLLAVQLQFAATIEQLRAMLVEIEAQSPVLFVEALQITPIPVAFSDRGDLPGMLEIRLDVAGATPRAKPATRPGG